MIRCFDVIWGIESPNFQINELDDFCGFIWGIVLRYITILDLDGCFSIMIVMICPEHPGGESP